MTSDLKKEKKMRVSQVLEFSGCVQHWPLNLIRNKFCFRHQKPFDWFVCVFCETNEKRLFNFIYMINVKLCQTLSVGRSVDEMMFFLLFKWLCAPLMLMFPCLRCYYSRVAYPGQVEYAIDPGWMFAMWCDAMKIWTIDPMSLPLSNMLGPSSGPWLGPSLIKPLIAIMYVTWTIGTAKRNCFRRAAYREWVSQSASCQPAERRTTAQ